MKNLKLFITFAIIAVSVVFTNNLKAQDTEEEKTSPFSVNGDIVSRYIWRGAVASPTLNFQPAASFTLKNFTIGSWGSADILGQAKEIDFYLSYSIMGFSLTFSDYCWNVDKRYFNYDSENTGHVEEIGLSYENEIFPLKIYAGTMVYGEDKKSLYDPLETDLKKQNFSTYFELSYTFNIKQNTLMPFIGATLFTGMYGNDFAVVYTGFTASRDIKITEKFSLPIFTTFAANPQTEDFFVIFGISL